MVVLWEGDHVALSIICMSLSATEKSSYTVDCESNNCYDNLITMGKWTSQFSSAEIRTGLGGVGKMMKKGQFGH